MRLVMPFAVVKIGALVNKLKAFSERKWERFVFKIADIFDGFNSFIFLEVQNLTVVRVLPDQDFQLNAWLLDFVKLYYLNISFVPDFQILMRTYSDK